MKFNINLASLTGRLHEHEGKLNEDAYKIFETDKLSIMAISDGCGSSPSAAPASKLTVQAAIDFSVDLFNKNELFSLSDKELKHRLVSFIRNKYRDSAFPYNELAATLIMVIIDKSTGRFLTMSLGDGSLLCVLNNFEVKLLERPKNILFMKNRTYFFIDEISERMITVTRDSFNNKSGIIALVPLTDGAQKIISLSQTNKVKNLACLNILNKKAAGKYLKKIAEKIYSTYTNDDATIGLISLTAEDSPEFENLARATCTAVEYLEDALDEKFSDAPNNEEVEEIILPDEENPTDVDNTDKPLSFIEFLNTKGALTPEELIASGFVCKNNWLSTAVTLIRLGVIHYENGVFSRR